MTIDALIIGGTGQDGSYLIRELLRTGKNIVATFRSSGRGFDNVETLKLRKKVTWIEFSLGDYTNIYEFVVNKKPECIFIFSGLSDTHLSFRKASIFFEHNTKNLIQLIEMLAKLDYKPKIFVAGSIDEYLLNKGVVDEASDFKPASPYGISRVATHMYCNFAMNYYKAKIYYGIFCSHESKLRDRRFFTSKVSSGICNYIEQGVEFELGDLSSLRDWGYAPEYMKYVASLLQGDYPEGDYLFCTNKLTSCKEYLEEFLRALNINFFTLEKPGSLLYINSDTNQLICKAKSKKYDNSHDHPYCNNKKLINTLGITDELMSTKGVINTYIQEYFNSSNS
jgi:GDPmannose 4,6-dehydratase